MGRKQQKGGYARKTENQPYANSTGRSQRAPKKFGAATALGLGVQRATAERDACEHDRTAGNHTTELAGLVIWISRSEPIYRLEY